MNQSKENVVKSVKISCKITESFQRSSDAAVTQGFLTYLLVDAVAKWAAKQTVHFDEQTTLLGADHPTEKPRAFPKGTSSFEFAIPLPLTTEMATLATFCRNVPTIGIHKCLATLEATIERATKTAAKIKETFPVSIRPLIGGALNTFGTPINVMEAANMAKCCATGLPVSIGVYNTQPLFFVGAPHAVAVVVKNGTEKAIRRIKIKLVDEVSLRTAAVKRYSAGNVCRAEFAWKTGEVIDSETSVMHVVITPKASEQKGTGGGFNASCKTSFGTTTYFLAVEAAFDGGYKANVKFPVILASLPANYALSEEQMALGESIRLDPEHKDPKSKK